MSNIQGTGEVGIGMAGGMSWTENWLQFDNSYYRRPYQSRNKEHRKKESSLSGHKDGNEECKDAVVKDRTESLSSAGTMSVSESSSRPDCRLGLGEAEAETSPSRIPSAQIVAGRQSPGHGHRESSSNEMDTSCSDSNSNSNCSASSLSRNRVQCLSASSSSSSSELLWLPTDEALSKAPEFKFYFDQYAKDQNLFFADYTSAHRKMSELGAKFDPPEGIEYS